MTIDPNIKNKAQKIRTEIYGKDVRESLASGLEAMSEEVVNNKNRQDTVEQQFQDVLDETTDKDFNSAPEIKAARGGHDNLSQRLLSTDQQLAHTVLNAQGQPLAPLGNVITTSPYSGTLPIFYHDGWLYGIKNNTTIVKSQDEGKTWMEVATAPYGSIHSILWTNDGEVLVTNSSTISKSTGWLTNPKTVTWRTVVSKSKSTGVGILPWGIDGDGTKFIATEYSAADRSDSRYVWISTDEGNTWSIALDKTTIDPTNKSHMHGVAYDRWADRFFLSHGHGDIMGVYWSDDDGVTWTKIGGAFQPNAAPTTLTATDNGIVLGSDSGDAGLYGIARTARPEEMEMRPIARWDIEVQGVMGFAYRSVRDEKTGQVYVGFKSDNVGVSSAIMAGTATTGSQLWKSPTIGFSKFLHLAVTDKSIISLIETSGVNELIVASKPTGGVSTFDQGNIQNGVSRNTQSIAIGKNVEVTTANELVIGNNATFAAGSATENVLLGHRTKGSSRSTAIGNDAKNEYGSSDSIAIGAASVAAVNGIAIGSGASVPLGGTGGVSIGKGSIAYTSGVAIGSDAKNAVSGASAVAIGANAYSGSDSVSIGQGASAGTAQIAIGKGVKATHTNSIGLGASTTATNQLNIGSRYLEMKNVSEPVSVPAGTGRLFVMYDESNNLQLCVRMGNKTTVLATNVV